MLPNAALSGHLSFIRRLASAMTDGQVWTERVKQAKAMSGKDAVFGLKPDDEHRRIGWTDSIDLGCDRSCRKAEQIVVISP